MTPMDVAFIKAVVIGVFVAGTGFTGYWLRLRARQLSRPALQDELEALRQELELLRQEMDGRLFQVEDRMDFAERRMVQGGPDAPRPIDPMPTPV